MSLFTADKGQWNNQNQKPEQLKHLKYQNTISQLISSVSKGLAGVNKAKKLIRYRHLGAYIGGVHLFPFRTEKLSPPEPMVLR
jgi:hypothetical protein